VSGEGETFITELKQGIVQIVHGENGCNGWTHPSWKMCTTFSEPDRRDRSGMERAYSGRTSECQDRSPSNQKLCKAHAVLTNALFR